MCKSDQMTTSITSTGAELTPAMCQDPTRRALILTALATGACLASSKSSVAEEDLPGSNERPQNADVLVFSEGDRAGETIKPQDLKTGGPPVRAWPKDPKTSVVRKGSRLNEVLVVKLDPAELDEETRSRAAGGVVAYPRQSAQVVFGPAPRRLPALPLAPDDGPLTVAATFVGKVGVQQAR
jgi:rieske iron-sulfur protein